MVGARRWRRERAKVVYRLAGLVCVDDDVHELGTLGRFDFGVGVQDGADGGFDFGGQVGVVAFLLVVH